MPTLVMTCELQETERSVLERLEKELVARHYQKVFNDRTWAGTYSDAADVERAVAAAQDAFRDSAVAAGVRSYNLRIYGCDEKTGGKAGGTARS